MDLNETMTMKFVLKDMFTQKMIIQSLPASQVHKPFLEIHGETVLHHSPKHLK